MGFVFEIGTRVSKNVMLVLMSRGIVEFHVLSKVLLVLRSFVLVVPSRIYLAFLLDG